MTGLRPPENKQNVDPQEEKLAENLTLNHENINYLNKKGIALLTLPPGVGRFAEPVKKFYHDLKLLSFDPEEARKMMEEVESHITDQRHNMRLGKFNVESWKAGFTPIKDKIMSQLHLDDKQEDKKQETKADLEKKAKVDNLFTLFTENKILNEEIKKLNLDAENKKNNDYANLVSRALFENNLGEDIYPVDNIPPDQSHVLANLSSGALTDRYRKRLGGDMPLNENGGAFHKYFVSKETGTHFSVTKDKNGLHVAALNHKDKHLTLADYRSMLNIYAGQGLTKCTFSWEGDVNIGNHDYITGFLTSKTRQRGDLWLIKEVIKMAGDRGIYIEIPQALHDKIIKTYETGYYKFLPKNLQDIAKNFFDADYQSLLQALNAAQAQAKVWENSLKEKNNARDLTNNEQKLKVIKERKESIDNIKLPDSKAANPNIAVYADCADTLHQEHLSLTLHLNELKQDIRAENEKASSAPDFSEMEKRYLLLQQTNTLLINKAKELKRQANEKFPQQSQELEIKQQEIKQPEIKEQKQPERKEQKQPERKVAEEVKNVETSLKATNVILERIVEQEQNNRIDFHEFKVAITQEENHEQKHQLRN